MDGKQKWQIAASLAGPAGMHAIVQIEVEGFGQPADRRADAFSNRSCCASTAR
jgi:hypothetical protein